MVRCQEQEADGHVASTVRTQGALVLNKVILDWTSGNDFLAEAQRLGESAVVFSLLRVCNADAAPSWLVFPRQLRSQPPSCSPAALH